MNNKRRLNCRNGGGVAKTLLFLHVLLLIYSFSGVFSKSAAQFAFPSVPFIALYGGMLLILFVYALGWQQIIKRLPLTLAFANKAITVIWGIVWGVLFFGEQVNAGMIFGAVVVMVGIALYSTAPSDAGEGGERK